MKKVSVLELIALLLFLVGLGGMAWKVFPVHAQTLQIVTSQSPYGLQFAAAYYAAQNPLKAPFYNQRPGGGAGPMLTAAGVNSLVAKLNAANVVFDEQIDYWGWDPLTVMEQRQLYGIPWVYPGLGQTLCTNVNTPGCVITPSLFAGAPPAGAIVTCTTISCFAPWPVSTPPTTIALSVGVSIAGPYYEVIGSPVPVAGTVSTNGKCTLAQIPNGSMFGDGTLMNVWNCPNGPK